MKPEVLLIDLSSLGHMIYHVSASEPDPDYTSKAVVARVHALAQGVEHVGIMCDSGPSFRKDVSADYKANRPERDAILMHQMGLIRDQLAADGFPVISAPGYEADDLLGTGTALARAAGHPVMVVTSDKDLSVLITDEDPVVRLKSVQTGNVLDTEGVVQKWGVLPAQMTDYLCLVGDASDNIKGAAGIGPKGAVELLKQFGTLDDLYGLMSEIGLTHTVTPKRIESLRELKTRLDTVRMLVRLADVPDVDLSAILKPRPVPTMSEEPMTKDEQMDEDIAFAMSGAPAKCDEYHALAAPCSDPNCWQHRGEPVAPVVDVALTPVKAETQAAAGAMVMAPPARVVSGEIVPYERQLDPRNPAEAVVLSDRMHASKLFLTSYGSPQAVLSTIMMGREMGIPAMTALRTIQIVKGRHSMSAQLLVGLTLRSGLVEYVEPVEISETSVTYAAKRKGRPEIRLTHTIAMAEKAGLVKADSGWTKNPTDMLVARCSARICRIVAPEVSANVYTPEEIREMKESDNG